ncbi:Sortase family protein [Micromonospora pattaloongensis]|uniref:Sortase family protein n=1 Tax=Micromonospora pattaloongensis TaxID=405436 RepID=A0A1H3JAK3_9ACTN|nr:Sortase family protein [Micromonospora pattaloongensis]
MAGTRRLAVALVVVGALATATGLVRSGAWSGLLGGDRPPPRAFPVLPASPPIRIAIPSIHVRAPVHAVGLADDGSIAAPPLHRHQQAGWFERGPTPGEFGPAVIVGHVDTRTGPSIFHDLARLRPGARVEVTRRDRAVAVFEVNSVERFDKARLPIERVHGDFARPGLRLITCGGRWRGGGIGYADNVVVFASLIAARDP